MYKLQVQTKTTLQEILNPIDVRIDKNQNINRLEIKDNSGDWILVVRFVDLSYLEEKEIEENALNVINDAIKKRKNYVFVDV